SSNRVGQAERMCVPTVGLPAFRRSRSRLRRMAMMTPPFLLLDHRVSGTSNDHNRWQRARVVICPYRILGIGSVAYAPRCLSIVERLSGISGISAGPSGGLGPFRNWRYPATPSARLSALSASALPPRQDGGIRPKIPGPTVFRPFFTVFDRFRDRREIENRST